MTSEEVPDVMTTVGVTADLLADLRAGRAVYVRLAAALALHERVEVRSGLMSVVAEACAPSSGVDVEGRWLTVVRMCREVR